MLMLAAISGLSLVGLDATVTRDWWRVTLCALGLALCWSSAFL